MNKLARFPNAKQPTYQTTTSTVTYSEEGFLGGLAGFIVGGLGLFPGMGLVLGSVAKVKVQKLEQDIKIVSERIAKLRNKQIDASVKKGLTLPNELKIVDGGEVIKGALLGNFFGPIYGIFLGSELQNLNEDLQKKLIELERLLDKEGIITDKD